MLFRALNDPRRGFDHGDLIEICGRSVRLRVHAGARRISLRLDPRDQIIVATAPDRRRLKEAVAFAESRAEWIETQLRKLPVAVSFAPGLMITVEGAPCRLERAAMRISPRLKPATGDEPARLLAYGTDEAYSRAVVRCLKATAAQRLEARTRVHATALGRPMPNVFVTDAKARWGSCPKAFALSANVPGSARGDRRRGAGWPYPLFLAADPGALRGAGLCRRPRMRASHRSQSRPELLGFEPPTSSERA